MPEAPILDPATLARLGREAGGAGFAVIDASGTRLLHLSPAAAAKRAALADPAGAVRSDTPAAARLQALAAGAAPRDESRRENLRFGRLAPPIACRCRLAALPNGGDVLLLAFDADGPAASSQPMQNPADAAATAEIAAFLSSAGAVDLPAVVSLGQPAPPRQPPPQSEDSWFASIRNLVTETLSNTRTPARPAEAPSAPLPFPSPLAPPHIAALPPPVRTGGGAAAAVQAGPPPPTAVPEDRPAPPAGEPADAVGVEVTELPPACAAEAVPVAPAADAPPEDEPAVAGPEVRTEASSPSPPAEQPPLSAQGAEAARVSRRAVPPPPERSSAPGLTSAERNAFREIARALGARFDSDATPHQPEPPPAARPHAERPATQAAAVSPHAPATSAAEILDRLPVGLLIHRGDEVLFANRLLLEMTMFESLAAIAAEGGLPRLFRNGPAPVDAGEEGIATALATSRRFNLAVVARSATVPWEGGEANALLMRQEITADQLEEVRKAEVEASREAGRVRELEAILDTATDGVVVLDGEGRILSLNRSAEALFGYDEREVAGQSLTVLLAPESHRPALDYLDGLKAAGVASLLNDGREVLGRVRQGAAIPLFMTVGTASEGPPRKFCAVLRDITAFKTAEGELVAAKRAAEEASAQKSDLLAKISHEIRTPLSAIIGFAEVMLEERFGPIGNDRYKDYLKDVHSSGAHVISLVNDLLDLAKIEAGRLDLTLARLSLNQIVAATVTLLQPQAARERIVMRTSFAPKLSQVLADERSIRQIVLNLVSNAIKFTDAGGQVIVSTAPTDRGEIAFRVRDTGIGMTSSEIEQALEPFRQVATARKRGGTGLGLPLTKALVEANRGALQITSNPREGTLVEVLFPPSRVLAG